MACANSATLNVKDALAPVLTALIVLLDSSNADLLAAKSVLPTNSLTEPTTSASPVEDNAKPAQVLTSVPLAPTLKPYQLMESATTAHIHAKPAEPHLLSVELVSKDSVSSVLPVSLHALPEHIPRTVSVSATLDISTRTNVLLNVQLAMETLPVNARNVMITVLHVMDSQLCAQPAKMDLL